MDKTIRLIDCTCFVNSAEDFTPSFQMWFSFEGKAVGKECSSHTYSPQKRQFLNIILSRAPRKNQATLIWSALTTFF